MKQPVTAAPGPRLLTISAAAAYLSTTVWQMRTLGWKKSIPVIRLGNRWLFDRQDLDLFIDRAKVGTA